MARTKFKTITMEYAGADLLAGGMLAEVGGALNGSTRYTTQAVAHLGADAVALDECGNLEGECSVSVAVDYGTEAEMLADVLARQAFCDGHQRGVLRRACGGGGANARVELTPPDAFSPSSNSFAVRRTGGEAVGAFDCGSIYDAADFVEKVNDLGNWGAGPGIPMTVPLVHAELDAESGRVVLEVVDAEWGGTAGNALYVDEFRPDDGKPFADEPPVPFSGGADGVELAYEAGLSGFEYSSTLGCGGLRVVYTYGFILGGAAGA